MRHLLKKVRQPLSRIVHTLRARKAKSALDREVRVRARPALKELRKLKAQHPDRKFCGILLVEHIGDIVACEPVIGWVRREVPNSFIIWILKDSYKELLASHPGLDAVVTVRSLAEADPIIRSRVFDTCVDLHVNHKPTGVPDLNHVKQWGDPSINAVNYLKHGSILSAFSKGSGLPPVSGAPKLYIPETATKRVDLLGLPDSFIAVHTASNEKAKDWPCSEWIKLVQFLAGVQGMNVIELGLNQTLNIEHSRFQSLCGRLSLMETAEVIRRARFFIGIDSALAHMANALERPGLILFSRYRGEDSFLPYEGLFAGRSDEMILRHPSSLDSLPASLVIEKLKQNSFWPSIARN
ncbi:MAG: glycosyltransferase family 9 protein [Limisphaerales bacterium]